MWKTVVPAYRDAVVGVIRMESFRSLVYFFFIILGHLFVAGRYPTESILTPLLVCHFNS